MCASLVHRTRCAVGRKGVLARACASQVTPHRVSIIGSGNWGSVAARIVAQNAAKHPEFDERVRMWVFEEEVSPGVKLSNVINKTGENVKYLPGVHLGDNLRAVPDLRKAVEGSTLLVFVTPHQFIKGVCDTIKPALAQGATAISLIKGMEVTEEGFDLISELIQQELGIQCSVLMGANIANEIARERFSEATVGYREGEAASGELWQQLFDPEYFHVRAVPDVVGCELCGTLKNIVAIGAGFVDGLELGNNTKAAIMRIGLVEMQRLAQELFPSVQTSTFFESAGVADLITTCFGGRNRKCAEAYVKYLRAGTPKTWLEIEAELLGGQKLQGVLTSHEVQAILRRKGLESRLPLFTTINRICTGELPPEAIVKYMDAAKV